MKNLTTNSPEFQLLLEIEPTLKLKEYQYLYVIKFISFACITLIVSFIFVLVLAVFSIIKGQDLSILDNYRQQRYNDSIQVFIDSMHNDSLRRVYYTTPHYKDSVPKTITVFDIRVDSMQAVIDNMAKKLCKDNKLRQIIKEKYNCYDINSYTKFLLSNQMKDTSTITAWLIEYKNMLQVQYDMLYVVLDLQYGNTRSRVFEKRRLVGADMICIHNIIMSLSMN